ncbi:MAG: hypothetical protein AB1422_00300 [bacterium]
MNQETIFIQFLHDKARNSIILNNGFSNVYNECKNAGDFFWSKHYSEISAMEKNCLPIKNGKAYISAFYYDHLMQSYIWARQYPDIRFIAGGPAVRYANFTSQNLPYNLTLSKGLAEKVIFLKDKPNKTWDIDIPVNLIKGKNIIRFAYNIDRRCYWGKCIFCDGYNKDWESPLNNNIDNLKIPKLNGNINKIVRLNIPSITPKFLKNEVPKLPRRNDVIFDFFIRAGKEILPVITQVLEDCANGIGPAPEQFRFVIGVEFPSDRMLQYMGKGTSRALLLKLLSLAERYKISVGIPFIFGWNNLTLKDVQEAVDFIKKVEQMEALETFSTGFTLEIHPNSPVFKQFKTSELIPIRRKIFNNGECRIKLNKEQQELNEAVRSFYLHSKINSYLYDSEIGNINYE